MGDKDINVTVALVLFIVFLYLMQKNMECDERNKAALKAMPCHKEVDIVVDDDERLKIESVIEDYWKKRAMNKSKCSKVMNSIQTGMIRGALGGAIVGGGMHGAVSGAVVFGSMSGIMKAYNLAYSKSVFHDIGKFT